MTSITDSIGHSFKDNTLLELALTHPSLHKTINNQRLEFLGDAVLGLVIAKILYSLYPDEQEGDLARRQAALVRSETLAQIAKDISLGDAINMSEGEESTGGRNNTRNLEDAMEALIGAIYLDGNIEAAEKFITPHWEKLALETAIPPVDAKTSLQEWAQAKGLPVPKYELINTTGPAHAPKFTIEASVEGYAPAEAKANAKRVAEQLAATILLERLSNE